MNLKRGSRSPRIKLEASKDLHPDRNLEVDDEGHGSRATGEWSSPTARRQLRRDECRGAGWRVQTPEQ
jgi:hypothetical protein